MGKTLNHIFLHMSNLKYPPKVIAKNLEQFTSMEIDGVMMKDSSQFLNCGLDKLVTNLKEKGMKEGKLLKETFSTTYYYFKEKWGGKVDEEAFELQLPKKRLSTFGI